MTSAYTSFSFPHAIDSTILASFRSCPQKAFRTYMQHWKPRGESVHLVAGKAFASGIEAARWAFFRDGKTPAEAVAIGLGQLIKDYGDFQCPPESPKSLERTAGALEFYFDNYPLGTDKATPIRVAGGGLGIEFSFAEPIEGFVHPETHDPLLYVGRADMVADYAGGVYVFDEKTASQLGASWAKQWEMRSQFTGYVWAGHKASIPVLGVIVRGVSILKTKYDTQQALCGRQPWELSRWEFQLKKDIRRLMAAYEEARVLESLGRDPASAFDWNLDHACAEYGGCPLLQICKVATPESFLPTYFERRVWDPVEREELSPEAWEAKWAKTPPIIMP